MALLRFCCCCFAGEQRPPPALGPARAAVFFTAVPSKQSSKHTAPLPACPCLCSGWLEFVEEVRQQVGQVALLTCPVDRLRRKQHAEGRKLVAQRNERLRAMVARGRGGDAAPAGPEGQDGQQDSNQPLGGGGGAASRRRLPDRGGAGSAGTARPLLLMDLDGITQRLPPRSNLGVAPIDFHYQCMLSSTTTYDGAGPIRWGGGDGSPSPTYPVMRYERLLVPPAGTCADPVNYAGWELLLGMLCRAE